MALGGGISLLGMEIMTYNYAQSFCLENFLSFSIGVWEI